MQSRKLIKNNNLKEFKHKLKIISIKLRLKELFKLIFEKQV